MMMKRKKQKTAQPPPTTSAPSDIKSLIRKNSSFFDNVIELIPAKFYLPTDDDSKPYFQGLKKAAKQAAKQQTKDNIKKSRRDRLDPDKSHTSTLDLLKQTLEKEKQAAKAIPGPTEDDVGPVRSVTFEELQQRLHRRIEELRGNRGGGEAWRSEKREKRENEYRKRKRGDDDDQVEGEKNGDGRGGNIGKSEDEIEKKVTKASKRIEFGKLKIGSGEERRKKKKLSKEKELEMAKRLEEEVKKDPAMAKKHSWKAAVSRASGDKVHDDPKLLKQSMNKEKRRHEKNVGKWKERVESREKVKGEKQQKRAGNIAERIHQKKMRKIAKREKKLMRPGFEGRKEGYEPNTIDIADHGELEYWFTVLSKHLPDLVDKAVASEGGTEDAKQRGDAFARAFSAHLARLMEEPAAYGKLGLANRLELREEGLREFQFVDAYRSIKQRENEASLAGLPDLLMELDSMNEEARLLALIEGVLAANIFDWGSRACVDLYHKAFLKIYLVVMVLLKLSLLQMVLQLHPRKLLRHLPYILGQLKF